MELEDGAAIVTGGASGIGEATVRALAGRGARCLIVDRNVDAGSALAAETGGLFVEADVADADQVTAAVAAATELGPLRALVNGAGIGPAARTVDRSGAPHPLEDFERIVRVNLVGSFNCIRLAAAAMGSAEPYDADGARGAIVNLASIAAFEGQVGQAAYSASKAGIVGMTLPIARDLAPLGIRVNTVAPGLIDTPIYGSGDAAEAFKANLGRNVLFPTRLGTADELASMIIELLTNDYVNGETIRVDGGVRLPPK